MNPRILFNFILLQITLTGILFTYDSYGFSMIPPEAGVVIKNDNSCFYSLVPITYDNGEESTISLGVIDDVWKDDYWETLWEVNNLKLTGFLPDSPERCIPYGTTSTYKNENDVPTHPLLINKYYNFTMAGQSIGYQELDFCISKDAQGKKYISKFNKRCTKDPLIQEMETRQDIEDHSNVIYWVTICVIIFIVTSLIIALFSVIFIIKKWK